MPHQPSDTQDDATGTVPTDAGASLAALVARAERAGKGAPPVERWEPEFCGDIDMVIHADGHWSYNGSPIGRPALVRLFSTVLRKDADGRTYLVTPVEKLGITVEDAHLTFRTDVGDVCAAGPENPLRLSIGPNGEFRPYVTVRGRLEARLTRALAFDLADHVETDGERQFVRSGGATFDIAASQGGA